MPRRILFGILMMVGTSVVTAFCYQRWLHGQLESPLSGLASFTSQQGTVDEVQNFGGVFRRREPASIGYELKEECQNTHQSPPDEIEKLPVVFREARSRAPADFPVSCLALMMKKKLSESKIEFGICREGGQEFEKEPERPCVAEPYLNAVYNLFGDITSCFGIPQRDFLPKIFFESSGHATAVGPQNEIGLAQLSEAMINSANTQFDFYKKQALANDSEACQRLAPLLQNLVPIDPKQKKSNCELMSLPLNLFYMAIRYEQNFETVELMTEKLNIENLMHKAGIEKYEKEQLQQILVSLASNAGPVSAVIYLRDYLQLREELVVRKKAKALSLADFDFRNPIMSQGWPIDTSFPAYLAAFQNTGTPAYLNFVTTAARFLNTKLKEGTCVSESFLSLSL